MRFWFILILLAGFGFSATAQKVDSLTVKTKKDSLREKRDSIRSKPFVPKAATKKVYHPDSLHSPHQAFMRSLILPGWGQVYNHRWWKVPIIYTGFGLLGAAIVYNQHYYNLYITEARVRQNGLTSTSELKGVSGGFQQFYDAAALNQRNFQLSIFGVLGVWGINCLDAYIDGKFIHSYTVDDNLTFKVTPTVINSPMFAANNYGFVPGVKVTFVIK